ncbi:MAG: hypothetical protein ACKVN9_02815 [Methylophilaceae bacterium]
MVKKRSKINSYTKHSLLSKFYLICLLILLPLQFSQAAMVAYGEHDVDVVLHPSVANSGADADTHSHERHGKHPVSDVHSACGLCHLYCVTEQSLFITPLPLSKSFPPKSFRPDYSTISDNIERPKWPLAI